MFDETLDVYPHEKTFKGRQQSMLDQQLTSTEQVMRHKQYQLPIIRMFYANVLGTSFSLNLTLVCNTICLSFTIKVKNPVPSSHHLVNTST
jgi:hypothetical protein